MKILMLTVNDPAGMGIAFSRAINKHTDHTCRLISTEERYGIDFAKDIHLPDQPSDSWDQIHALLTEADIFHFHILSDESMTLGPFVVKDFIKGKKLLHHHHGHPDFRSNPGAYREKYHRLRRKTLVSTPDLLKLLPEAMWMPNIVPVHDELFTPLKRQWDGKVRICQSPTKKELKNTVEFRAVVDDLQKKYPEAEGVIIENTVYADCLSIKRNCDIHFDHMQGYYGVSSLESLSQGKPVIAGLDSWNISHIREFCGDSDLPWLIARNRDELHRTLEHLISDSDVRDERGAMSRAFMVNHWNDRILAEKLVDFYHTL